MASNFSSDGGLSGIAVCRSMAATIGKELQEGGLSMDTTQSVLQEFNQGQKHYVSSNRGFGEIYRDGPGTFAEAALLITAMAFLEPAELQNAVDTNMPVSNVAQEVEQNKAKNLAEQMVQEQMQKRLDTEQHHPVEHDNPLGGGSLNVEYGVLNEMTDALRRSGINELESASPGEVHKPNTPDARPLEEQGVQK